MLRSGGDATLEKAEPPLLRSGTGHVLISGMGRSGTTLLVQIFTHLGFDTGFSREEALMKVDGISRAGLEWNLNAPDLPYVAKSPIFADHIAAALDRGLNVEAAIIPLRDLFQAAESRRHVYRQVESIGGNPLKHPGSLWSTTSPSDQENALARQFSKLLEPLVARGVPLVLLAFPRFATDGDYFYESLKSFFSRFDIPREEVLRVHGELVDPSLITKFQRGPGGTSEGDAVAKPGGPGLAAEVHDAERSAPAGSAGLETYLSPASFWWPDYIEPSAWIEHAPFGFWLVNALRPRTIVELGTQLGYSYFAFCQAVKALGIETRCHAVDTWRGDEHAGFHGNLAFQKVSDYNQQHYGGFSQVVRSTFDDALPQFENGRIDLLHINGQQNYADARRQFESWLPKLSDRAVVLLHDTNVRERNSEVFRLWGELKDDYPSFEFHHGSGLGILGVGANLPPALSSFLSLAGEPGRAVEIRGIYHRLGAAPKADFDLRRAESSTAAKLKRAERVTVSQTDKLKQLEVSEKLLRTEASAASAELALRQQEVRELSTRVRHHEARIARLEAEARLRDQELVELRNRHRAQAKAAQAALQKKQEQVDRLKRSASWRLTSPLRKARELIRKGSKQRTTGRS